jgi:hypothetical protein
MAEEPRVFTVGPWGYRILLPLLLNTFLPPRHLVPGFEWAAAVSLVLASGLLFIYLRLLGATLRASLLAGFAVMLLPSVSEVFANPFLVEPFALMLLLAALIAIEGRASSWAVAFFLLLLSLSKEIWVLLLPLVFFKERQEGAMPALRKTLRVAAPAAWVGLLMRVWWASSGGTGASGVDHLAALGVVAANAASILPAYLLGGLTVAAIVALRREDARAYLGRNALSLSGLLALPLVAAVYTGDGAATSFFADDVRRLLIYVVPFAAGLAIHLDPGRGESRELPKAPRLDRVFQILVGVGLVAPLGLDRYARVDLGTSRDGPYVLGFARETLRTARKLDRSETVVLDPQERKFAWGVSPPNELQKLRFFLRSGFGPLAHYGIHDIRMREPSARLIAPVLEPRRLWLKATMDARESVWITVLAGGRKLGEALVGPQAVAWSLEVPGDVLVRGDNVIELRCEKAATAMPRILQLKLSQGPTP